LIKIQTEEAIFNKFYITTTLPYANAVPHVGHAIEFFQADAYARYFRRKLGKENVFFNVGVDEHGLKVFTTAKEHGSTPEAYLDALIPHWLDFCSKFRIGISQAELEKAGVAELFEQHGRYKHFAKPGESSLGNRSAG
jgi:leucyl-tRNA synthetase